MKKLFSQKTDPTKNIQNPEISLDSFRNGRQRRPRDGRNVDRVSEGRRVLERATLGDLNI